MKSFEALEAMESEAEPCELDRLRELRTTYRTKYMQACEAQDRYQVMIKAIERQIREIENKT